MTSDETYSCDLVVVGTGAGGLSAAVTARASGLDVLVVEKAPVFGGTTARSGGWLWVPGNRHAREAGFSDSTEEARTYLKHETGNHFDADRIDAFLEAGPKMVDWFEERTAVRFLLGPTFADYHPTAPGGKDGGRSICAEPFDVRALGPFARKLRPPLKEITFLGMMIGSGKELLHFFNVTRSAVSMAFVARLLARHTYDVARHGRGMRATNGNALAARLGRTAFVDLRIPLWLESPAEALIEKDGRVVGARVSREGRPVAVRASRGVVLAAGGFPWDVERRRELFPHAPTGREHNSPAPRENTGDGVRLGETVGGHAQTELPNAAAWVPVSKVRWPDGSEGVFPHFVDRSKPGVIAVNWHGVRFVNEANSYHDFIQALLASYGKDDPGEICAWFVCDHKTIRRYGLGFVKPAPLPLGPHLRSGYLVRGDTPEALARAAGFDPAAFRDTVDAFNGPARRGEDHAFGKGSTSYNRSLGDPDHRPNPCVAPLEVPPYYAVKVVVGDLGTFAGLRTDRHARVVRTDGSPVEGLYAVGNDMGSIMGGNYPGGGITLGPAMTFGWIAGRHAAGVEA